MDKRSTGHQITLVILIGLLVLALCGIVALLFFIFFGDQIPNRRSAASTSQPPDAVWQRIQTNQKIVVGVSADYPPFSYVDPDFVLQGYDIALIQEIGRRVNLPLEVHNMAFDGLINALVLGQVDLAIAAISNTPERDQLVDFSTVYYVGEDAILARRDTSALVRRIKDLADYRVGVQKGSIYATWVQTALIDPGDLKPQDFYTFETFDQALDALTAPDPQIDLLVVDLLPALESVKTKPVKIIIQGLNPQNFSIAIPHGAYTLKSTLDRVLMDLQKDGTLAKLAQEYLQVEESLPLPTAAPTEVPVTPSACMNGMLFVQDLSLPDENMTSLQPVQPGTIIQKGWRIKNTGSCTWDNTYVLAFTDAVPKDAPVGGNPVAIQGLVPPGGTYDIYVTLTTPMQPGEYQSFWSMRSSDGATFGDRIWAGFLVVGQPTPTTAPVVQPPVILSFSASSTQIQTGQCLSLSWQFTGQQIIASRLLRNGAFLQGNLASTGSLIDCPNQSGQNQYQLVVETSGAGSAVAVQNVAVVSPILPTATPTATPPQPPLIFYFDADDTAITLGECTNLAWSAGSARLSRIQIFREGVVLASNLPASGTYQECPPETGQIEYVLRVAAVNGASAQASEFISVRNPGPKQPVITSFYASPTQIGLGSCTSLSWSIEAQGSNQTRLTRNGQLLADGLSYTGSFRDCINDRSLVGQVIYNLQISGQYGSDSQNVIVSLISALSSLFDRLIASAF